MRDFLSLPARNDEGNYLVVVEAPRGSTLKLKFDPKLGVFVFDRALLLGAVYPYDWGFVPSTCAEDGDPLDAMVLFDAPTWPGVLIPTVPIGVVRLSQREGRAAPVRNDRIITVPAGETRYGTTRDLPKGVRSELERFFVAVGEMTGKAVK